MEDVFHNSGSAGRSPWQRRGSQRLDERSQEAVRSSGSGQSPGPAPEVETDLDEEGKDLNTKKGELCEALRSSLVVLREDREVLAEEQRRHRALGSGLEALVQEHCRPNEKDKYCVFIGDLERIVNLLLSLCGRLARIHTTLLLMDAQEQDDSMEERDSLNRKRSQLLSQTDDARELKDNLDRRQIVVHRFLSVCLSESQLADYCRYVSIKPSLLIRQRHLDDLIRRWEELLVQLDEGMATEAADWSRGFPLPSGPAPGPGPASSLPPSMLPGLVQGHAHLVRPTTVTSL